MRLPALVTRCIRARACNQPSDLGRLATAWSCCFESNVARPEGSISRRTKRLAGRGDAYAALRALAEIGTYCVQLRTMPRLGLSLGASLRMLLGRP